MRRALTPLVLLAALVATGALAYAVAASGESSSTSGPTRATASRTAISEASRAAIRNARRHEFPGSATTGVPRGLRLAPYHGPCTITRDGAEIDGRHVRCDLTIRAKNVVISRSRIDGYISSGTDRSSRYSFTLEDSTVDASPHGPRQVTAVGEVHFTVIRSDVSGGNRGANCWYRCTIVGSWFHGQDTDRSGTWHESGIRMGSRAVIRANTIACDAPDVPPDAGCSAPLTGYGDFAPVRDNLIESNLFKATPGGTCAYGGSTLGKPFSQGVRGIRFVGNVFERGRTGRCGRWFAIADFDPAAPGNRWSDNVWEQGGTVRP